MNEPTCTYCQAKLDNEDLETIAQINKYAANKVDDICIECLREKLMDDED